MKVGWKRVVTWLVGLSVVGGGVTFCLKLYEFMRSANTGEMPGFAFATVVSYFVATAGFLCLALWAFLRGHYHDIEGPKYTLLETEAELDRAAGNTGHDGVPQSGGCR